MNQVIDLTQDDNNENDDIKSEYAGLVYILRNHRSNKVYVGWTVNPDRRIRQHNGLIKGGAKRTGVKAKEWERGQWYFGAHITGFVSRNQALSFEKYMQIRRNRKVGYCPNRHCIPFQKLLWKFNKLTKVYPDKFPNLTIEEF